MSMPAAVAESDRSTTWSPRPPLPHAAPARSTRRRSSKREPERRASHCTHSTPAVRSTSARSRSSVLVARTTSSMSTARPLSLGSELIAGSLRRSAAARSAGSRTLLSRCAWVMALPTSSPSIVDARATAASEMPPDRADPPPWIDCMTTPPTMPSAIDSSTIATMSSISVKAASRAGAKAGTLRLRVGAVCTGRLSAGRSDSLTTTSSIGLPMPLSPPCPSPPTHDESAAPNRRSG